jgi:hypothetical protein
MNATTQQTPAPIALAPDDGEAVWFLGSLATVKASAETTGGRVAVIEQLAPRGAGSPLHVHHREDEWFYVMMRACRCSSRPPPSTASRSSGRPASPPRPNVPR